MNHDSSQGEELNYIFAGKMEEEERQYSVHCTLYTVQYITQT